MKAVSLLLSSGEVVLVDAGDADLVRQFRWHKLSGRRTTYVQRHVRRRDGGRAIERLHTFLTGWTYVDHRNGNGLDNRRTNLRQATNRQNQQNQAARTGATSRYKGVCWESRKRRWRARIWPDNHQVSLGYFTDETDAARAYDAAARKVFGEFAKLNFPQPGEHPVLRVGKEASA